MQRQSFLIEFLTSRTMIAFTILAAGAYAVPMFLMTSLMAR